MTINNINPKKNFTRTFLWSPANTLWGCLPTPKDLTAVRELSKNTMEQTTNWEQTFVQKIPNAIKYTVQAKNSRSDISPSVSVFDVRYWIWNSNKQHGKQKTELHSYLQKPKKKLEIKVSKANLGMNVHIWQGCKLMFRAVKMRKLYTRGDLKTFDICYDNANTQGFFQ